MSTAGPNAVSAVLVTRGDHDLTEPILTLAPVVDEIVVWNNHPAADPDGIAAALAQAGFDDPDFPVVWANTERADLKVYGRYAAIRATRCPIIYVQDDDCVLEPDAVEALIAAHRPGVLTANMPEPFRAHYSDSCLVGFGAVFDRDLPERAFARYAMRHVIDFSRGGYGSVLGAVSAHGEAFARCCDVIFTTLTPQQWEDVPYRNLPWATDPDRMYRQPNHMPERAAVLARAREVRDA